MANTKGYMIRQKVLDKCLQSLRGYSIAEMMEKCNIALEDRMLRPITALNTIREDLTEISNTYHVNIEQVKLGRIKRYRYSNRNFSIYDAPLTEKDLTILQQTLDELDAFEGRPHFEWLENAKMRIQSVLACRRKEEKPIVSFEENIRLQGREYFQPLFDAIRQKIALEINYQNFNSEEPSPNNVHPYYLKQYNNRWFLFGEIDGNNSLSVFALDRIKSVTSANIQYVANKAKYDFDTYFDNIIGVSKHKHAELTTIQLRVEKRSVPYLRTKPIHPSQEEKLTKEDFSVFVIKVEPNYELYQQLLSYGSGLTILTPTSIRDDFMKILQEIENNYNKFSLTESISCNFALDN